MIGRKNIVKLIDCCYREPLVKFRIMKEKGFSLYTTGNIFRLYLWLIVEFLMVECLTD